jgi:hypothetical protein
MSKEHWDRARILSNAFSLGHLLKRLAMQTRRAEPRVGDDDRHLAASVASKLCQLLNEAAHLRQVGIGGLGERDRGQQIIDAGVQAIQEANEPLVIADDAMAILLRVRDSGLGKKLFLLLQWHWVKDARTLNDADVVVHRMYNHCRCILDRMLQQTTSRSTFESAAPLSIVRIVVRHTCVAAISFEMREPNNNDTNEISFLPAMPAMTKVNGLRPVDDVGALASRSDTAVGVAVAVAVTGT